MSGISFGFTKKTESAVKNKSVIDETVEEHDVKDFIKVVDDKTIVSVNQPELKGPLVIPLISKNKWRHVNETQISAEDEVNKIPEDSVKSAAVRELIADAQRLEQGNPENPEDNKSSLEIPLLMLNAVPEGYETDTKISTDIRPVESTLEEYESVPIDHFGVAMLRGMGWKEGDGIGRNNKYTAPVEATLRPKGMGLGADRSAILQHKSQGKKAPMRKPGDDPAVDSLSFKAGVNCVVTKKGEYMDLYGTIQGLDEDNSRCIVQLALSGANITFSQLHVRLVAKSEFDKYARYLNKGKSDEYKHRESAKFSAEGQRSEGVERKQSQPQKHKSHENRDVSADAKRSKVEPSARSREPRGWVHSHLRVKIIDKKFKEGRYYSTKVEVEDVLPNSVTCRTDSGRLLEDLTEKQLETVVPRSDNGVVMVVGRRLPHTAKLAQIIGRDKHKQRVTVQLLPDKDVIETYSYDDVCEYAGDSDLF